MITKEALVGANKRSQLATGDYLEQTPTLREELAEADKLLKRRGNNVNNGETSETSETSKHF